MSQQTPLPNLRFPEFTDDWQSQSLGETATFTKGKNISKSDIVEDGEIECIRYGELYTDYGEIINEIVSRTNLSRNNLIFSKTNDVIIPSSGETQLDIATASCVMKDDVALGGDLNIIRTKNNGIFISYYLNNKKKKDIASLAQGNSVVHLYNHQLKTLLLNIPSIQEQQKIANFLSAVDKRIVQLQEKKSLLEAYKKGVMQQIFSQQLRFAKEDGSAYPDWEEKRLGDFCEFFSGGTPRSTNKKFYSGTIPFIGSGNISDETVNSFISEDGLNSSSAKMVNKGDLLYALYGATSGEVALSKMNGAINQAVLCIRTKANRKYLFQILKYNKGRIVDTYIQGGQGNLSGRIVADLKFNFPCIEEQTQIAHFLSAIDTKIVVVQTQIVQTQTFKKGLLQQMFV